MRRYSSVLTGLLAPALLLACGGDEPGPGTPKNARIMRFDASPRTIEVGQEVTLEWETTGTSGVNIEPRVGLQVSSGSATDRPLATTTYTLSIPGGPKDLTAQVTVEVTGGAPVVTEFKATPRTIAEGESATLQWSTSNADQVVIEPGIGRQDANGSVMVMPRVTTTYRLTATRGAQSAPPQEVVVVVASGNQPMVKTFTASPQTVSPGDSVTLSWEATNADSVTIDNGVGQQPVAGSVMVRPQQTTIYSLTAIGAGGSAVASVTVTVVPAGNPTILRFDATPMTISPGGSWELNWDTDNAASVSIDNGIGAQPAKGSAMVSPAQTTTYTLTAFGNGMMVTQQVTIMVAAPNAPVVLSFAAQPAAILQGGATTLSWMTQNASSVDIDNGGGTGLNANGSVQVTPGTTTTYTLTARGTGGMVTAQATVTVNAPPPTVDAFTAQPASITLGGMATLSWTTQNATTVSIDNGVGNQVVNGTAQVSPAQTTVYNLTAMGPGGMATAQVTVSVTQVGAPVIRSFTATPQQLSPGGSATLAWDVGDATSVTIDNGIGSQPVTGTRSVTPAQTTTYTLTAVGAGGMTTGQVTVTVVATVGDRCSDAFMVTASGTFTGNTQQAVNDYSASNTCTGYASTGPDVVYRVSLQAGDRLQAVLTPSNTPWDASLYLVTSCSAIGQSCVAGQDNGNPEEIDYTAAMPGEYFLIVDGYGGAGGTYSLGITLTAAPLANDRCMGAIDVGMGGSFAGDTTNAQNDYSPGSGGCTGYAEASNDVAYRVALASGERLQATLTASWDAALYVVTDCNNVATSCVAGQDNGNPEEIDYTAMSAGTYYLIVDGWGSARGAFTLDVAISPPVSGGDTCQNAVMVPSGGGSFQSTTAGLTNDYNPPMACTGYSAQGLDQVYRISLGAGDVVEVLAEFDPGLDGSTYVVQSCTGMLACVAGADSEVSGQPEELRFVAPTAGDYHVIVDSFAAGSSGGHDLTILAYSGETCGAAPPLNTTNTPEPYTTVGRANDYSPNSGGCTGYTAAAGDRAYSVAVNAGDQLQVDLAPMSYDASIYVVSNCGDINGSCVAGSDRSVTGAEAVSPVFQQSGTYYVVVDGFGSATGAGTITARIARGDTCEDAYRVPTNGGVFNGTTAGYAADYGATASAGSCTSFTQTGADAVYAVTLNNNQQLTASLTTTWDSALYLVSSCASAATTCLAGQDNGNPEELTYTNASGSTQTYYLIVDSWRPTMGTTTREGNYTLTIELD